MEYCSNILESPIQSSSPPMMDAPADPLNARIAARLRALRSARGDSLEALAQRSGVSRSMISVIERGESSPTAAVLEKLATALGVVLADLFSDAAVVAPAQDGLARLADQPQWRDPESGYRRRNVSPAGVRSPIQLVEVQFPAGARVAFDTAARDAPVWQQIWLRRGQMRVSLGDSVHALEAGDCLAMRLDRPTVFFNPGEEEAEYAVVIVREVGKA
jgi:transcriptional regulator with XRE-family HTH domain